jgi:NitT/TauT family transport system substrate-binding protein
MRLQHRLMLGLALFILPTIGHSQPVRMSYGGTSGYNVPFWVAQEAGLFKKHGLPAELVLITGAVQGMQAMLANEVHFVNGNGSAPINATLQGADTVIIATSYDLLPYSFVVHKDIRSPSDLRGKIVAISRLGGSTELAARVALERLGVDPKEVTLIQAGSDAQRIPAVLSGKIAGTVIAPPGLFAAVARGLKVLVDLTDLGIKYPTSIMYVTRLTLTQNREAVRKFLMAFMEALHLYSQKRDFSIETLRKYSKLNDAEALSKSHD